jgi:Secretion system C-terminal sorting domain
MPFFASTAGRGSLLWARQTKASVAAWGTSIIPDSEGNCYVTGFFDGNAFPDIGYISSETSQDLFLAKYDSDGGLLGVNHFGMAWGKRLGIDDESNPYMIGEFYGSIEVGQTSLNSYGDRDIVLCRSDKITNLLNPTVKSEDHLIIYANPTTGKCSINIPGDFLHEKSLILTIYNTNGKVIQTIPVELSENNILFNLSAQASGIYNAVLTNGKKSYSGRIVFTSN